MAGNSPFATAVVPPLFAVLGIITLALGSQAVHRNAQFAGDVVRITGTVTKVYTMLSNNGGKFGASTHYHLDYSFAGVGGKIWASTDEVTYGTYATLRAQSQVPVKYLPDRPDINRIDLPAEDRKHALDAWVFVGVGVLFTLVGGYGILARANAKSGRR